MSDISGSQQQDDGFFGKLVNNVIDSVSTAKGIGDLASKIFSAGAQQGVSIAAQGAGAYQAAASAKQAQGTSEAQVQTLEGDAAAKLKADQSVAALALGADPASIQQRGEQIRAQQQLVESDAKTVAGYAGQSIFDDPLKYIGSLIRRPAAEDRLDADQQVLDKLQGNLEKSTSLATNAGALDVSLDAASSTALTAAKAAAVKAAADSDAARLSAEAANVSLQGLSVAMTQNENQLDVAYKQMQGANIAFSTQKDLITTRESEARTLMYLDMHGQNVEQKATAEAQRSATAAFTNGAVPTTETQYKALGGPAKQAADTYNSFVTAGTYGPDPVTNYENVTRNLPVQPSSPGELVTRQWIGNVISQVGWNESNDPTKFGATPQQKQDMLQANRLDKIHDMVVTATKDLSQPGTPYTAPNIGTVLKVPMVNGTPLGQALSTLDKNAPLTGDTLAAAGLALVKKGMSPSDVGTMISNAVKQLQGAQNATMGYRRMGIPVFGEPGQGVNSYNMSYTAQSMFGKGGGRKIIDWSNPAQAGSAISREFNAARSKEQFGDNKEDSIFHIQQ